MGVARRQLGIGIADANDWASVEDVVSEALVSHPASVEKRVEAKTAEPSLGA
jgi:hypothetical protein